MAANALLKCFSVALDLKRSVSNRPFSVVDGDTGNRVVVSLTDDGTAVSCAGKYVTAVFSHSRGTAVQDSDSADGGISISGNVITIDLLPASFAPGFVECELQVLSSSQDNPAERVDYDLLVTSARFNFECRKAILNEDSITAFPEYPLLTGLIGQVQTGEAARTQAESSRVSAEANRAAAEAARVGAEAARVGAEAARVGAEASRTSQFNTMLSAIADGTLVYLHGAGAPSSASTDIVGQLYVDTSAGTVYICIPDSSGQSLDSTMWTQLLRTDGDGGSVTATRSMTRQFADVPANSPVNLNDLLAYLGGYYAEINGKQSILTFDSSPTADSANPVTSGGTYTALHKCDWQTASDVTLAAEASEVEYTSLDYDELRLTILGNLPDEDNSVKLFINGDTTNYLTFNSLFNSIGGSMTRLAELTLHKPVAGTVKVTRDNGGEETVGGISNHGTAVQSAMFNFNAAKYTGLKLTLGVSAVFTVGTRIILQGRKAE